jgi:signal peptidase I
MEPSQKKILLDALTAFGSCEITASGESMKPFIKPGDRITIVKPSCAPFPGQVIAFFNNHQLIVHRIWKRRKVSNKKWLLKVWGDSSPNSHGEIHQDSVIGIVSAAHRDHRRHFLWFRFPFCLLAIPLGFLFQAGILLKQVFNKNP